MPRLEEETINWAQEKERKERTSQILELLLPKIDT